MEHEAGEEIELEQHRVMIYIPENTIDMTVQCRVYLDGDVQEVSRTLTMAEVREAMRKADEGYIDDEDTFHLTDKGIAFLEEMRSKQLTGEVEDNE